MASTLRPDLGWDILIPINRVLHCYNKFRFQSRNLFIWGENFLGHVRSDVRGAGIVGYGVMDLLLPISMVIANQFC